ncbi:putative monooxygenase [Mycena sanguinolenta]|uniref:Putative monooxygenase n=1 Tax=Mycena sanguinolenta TaxID=230812 RepID=A0A8H6ZE97_9AGAR|nr:putative monooxygenase [Mycena sanguinolenta]
MSFFLAMMLDPSIQAKGRKEIDTVIGIMTEVLRWIPPPPLGVSHALSQDDVYEGMYLPKGSTVIPNVWYILYFLDNANRHDESRHMLHDPEIYPNPMDFNPERYQGLDTEMEAVKDIVFGFGRRACPGREFSEGTVFAIVATVLATCEILPTMDASGNAVLPEPTHLSRPVT